MPRRSEYDIAIPATNILSYLLPNESEPSDKPLWIDASKPEEKSLSPKQLLYWCRRLRYGLSERYGVQRGDVVLLLSHNHIFVPVAYLGVSGGGMVFSGCNPIYTVQEVAKQIKDTDCKILLVEPELCSLALQAARSAALPEDKILLFSDEPCQRQHGIQDWRTAMPDVAEAQTWVPSIPAGQTAASTLAVLNYSSGTTGFPKGVMISHQNVIANVEQSLFMRKLPVAESTSCLEERWLGFLPLYHAFGQLWTIVAACRTLTRCYIMRKFEFGPFLSHIQRHRITHLQTAPPVLVMLAKRPECASYDLSSLRNILCGAAPLSKSLQNEVSDKYHVRIVQTYGMTELTCSTFHVPGEIDDRSGSIGMIDPNVQVKLLDTEGKEVATGDRGELWIHGPNVCIGYWRNPVATRDVFNADGFLRTGDVAICDSKGWFWIVDRIKELIKVKGFQVVPAELEALLLEHQYVADAAVVGLQCKYEEKPMAYVVLKPAEQTKLSESELQDWVSTRVAKHKQVTGGVVFVPEIPRSPSGKILRTQIRQWAAQRAKRIDTDKIEAKL